MALHTGKIKPVIVYDITTIDTSSTLDTDYLILQGVYDGLQRGMYSSNSLALSSAIGRNYDESLVLEHISAVGANSSGDTGPHNGGMRPFGMLVAKKLMPGETLTISFYLGGGWQMASSSGKPTQDTTRVKLIYENRPDQIDTFMSTPEAATVAEGVGEIMTSNGTNVGVIKPWSYSSGHDYYDFIPCNNGPQDHSGGSSSYLGNGTSQYAANPAIMNSRLYFKANVPDDTSNYERYYSITIANDSGYPAAIRICPESEVNIGVAAESMNFHRVTLKCEKRSQFLPGPIITGRGDISANGSNFYGLTGNESDKPITDCQPISAESFNSYSYKVIPINCTIVHGSTTEAYDEFFALPIGGLYSFADAMTGTGTGDANAAGISPYASNFISAPFDGTIVSAAFCLQKSMGGSGVITLKLVKLSSNREANSEAAGDLTDIASVSFSGLNGVRHLFDADDLKALKFSKNDYIAILAKFSMPSAGPGGILGSILIRYKD